MNISESSEVVDVLKPGIKQVVLLERMSAVAWHALRNSMYSGNGSQLRDVSGVGSIELPTEESVRVGVTDDAQLETVKRWLMEFAQKYSDR